MSNVDMTIPGNGSYEAKLARATNWLHRRSEEDMGIYRDRQGRQIEPSMTDRMCPIVWARRAAAYQILETPPINQEERELRAVHEHGTERQQAWARGQLMELRRRALAGPIPASYRLLWIGRRSITDE